MRLLKQMLSPRDEALWQGSDAEADLVISLALTSQHNVAKKFQKSHLISIYTQRFHKVSVNKDNQQKSLFSH